MSIIYLDNAATTFPKPASVSREVCECIDKWCGNPGRGSHSLALRSAEALWECRCETASFFGCADPMGVCFTYNTTYALNMAIKAYVPRGSHILISDLEHNAVLRPVAERQRRGDGEYSIFSTKGSGAEVMRGMKRALRDNTAAVVCTLQSNISSNMPPGAAVGRFCREQGLLFVADGAQAAGHRPISMSKDGIHILCVPAHKGLYGPQGVGVMLVSEAGLGESFVEGGSGSESALLPMPEYLPDRYEAGTANTPGITGLLAGVRYLRSVGTDSVAEHERELWRRTVNRLASDKRFTLYGDMTPSSTVLLNKSGITPSELSEILQKSGICVRSGLHCAPLAHRTLGTPVGGAVRVSFGMFNTRDEADVLCDALHRA